MIIQPAQRMRHIEEYYFSTKLREIDRMCAAGQAVLNLGIGSPDLPPPVRVIEELTLQSRIGQNHAYQSYRGLPELRRAFADWYARYYWVKLNPQTEILPLIGSKEGIMHIAMAFLDVDSEALVPNPGYPTYAAASKLAGATVRSYDLAADKGWLPDLDALERTDLSRVKILWLNYPHMPTGTAAQPEIFQQLVAFARRHQILLVNDNPYSFILNEHPISILSQEGATDVAIELNSMSKSFNMAGWRIGCLCGRADYLDTVLKFKSNMDSGMFKPAQLAAAKALLLEHDWFESLNTVYRARKEKAIQLLRSIGCSVAENQVGMFVWARVPEPYPDGYAFSDEWLYEAHIFLTPGGIFGTQGDPYIRLSLCSSEATLEEAQGRIVAQQKVRP